MNPVPEAAISADDRALLARVAGRVVELRMEVPAVLTLETGRPLSLLAGQTLHFLEPFLAGLLPPGEYRRLARLIERREAVEALIHAIEERADEAQGARRAAAAARRAARKQNPRSS